jgi:hypothetical protein
MSTKVRPTSAKSKRKVALLPLHGDIHGPTQLRQQSYVGLQRPGAYLEAPGLEPVRSPAPRELQWSADAAFAPDVEESTGRVAVPSQYQLTSDWTEPIVTLEAEPVLSILVDATPVPKELPAAPSPDPSAHKRRRTRLFLLVLLVAIVAAGVATGVIVGSSKSESLPEVHDRTTPPAFTSDTACEEEAAALDACVETGNVTACAECVMMYVGWTMVRPCEESQSVTCGIEEACPACGNCQTEQVALANCQNVGKCDAFTCRHASHPPPTAATPPNSTTPVPTSVSTMDPTPVSTTAPTPVSSTMAPSPTLDECDDTASAFATCSNTSGEGNAACLSCIIGYVPATIDTCAESELYTCSAMEACPECGKCLAEFAAVANCRNRGLCDTITCS